MRQKKVCYRAICKRVTPFRANCKIEVFYGEICTKVVSYEAICKIAIRFCATYMIASSYGLIFNKSACNHAMYKITVCYLAIARVQLLIVQFSRQKLKMVKFES